MEPTRRVAGRLAATNVIEITQRGRVVALESVRGPIRLRLKPEAPGP